MPARAETRIQRAMRNAAQTVADTGGLLRCVDAGIAVPDTLALTKIY
jgi:hypothetical protein